MKRSIKHLFSKLNEDGGVNPVNGFAVFKNLRGGKLPITTNSEGTCTNNYTCTGTNVTKCNNTGTCGESHNQGSCSNSGTCFD